MSNSPRSFSQHLADCLARCNSLRQAARYGEALVWAKTATCLDSQADRVDPYSAVNKALFQIVFDVCRDSQYLVMKCGNITTTHGGFVGVGLEASEALTGRLDGTSADSSYALVQMLRSHFASFGERFEKHFKPAAYISTTAQEAQYMRDTTASMQEMIVSCEKLEVDKAQRYGQLAQLLYDTAVTPDYVVHGFPFAFMSDWDRAVFFIESARLVATSLRSTPGLLPVMRAATVARVDTLLEQALPLARSQNLGLKKLYPELSQLAERLTR
jgi:hypothetical protein